MSSRYPTLEWLSLRSDDEPPALIAHRTSVPVAAMTRATDPPWTVLSAHGFTPPR
jgi:hypothetical protein